ncbi:MAG: 2-C-methyl-D-erythritol 2,4-cyclodiphosphate synthase [Thermoleophilia bacterium]
MSGAEPSGSGSDQPGVRVGLGVDAHRFDPERPLVLGGVRIRERGGLAGHSDADVVVHALMDALLGAAGLEDIGHFFPDSDPAFKGADSVVLLRRVVGLLAERGLAVGNVDVVVICEEPRIALHRAAIKAVLAPVLGVAAERVGIRGTTTEGMGFAGRGEGIVAQAVALLEPRRPTPRVARLSVVAAQRTEPPPRR